MTQLASTRYFYDPVIAGVGLLLRLRAWFGSAHGATGERLHGHDCAAVKAADNNTISGAVLLPFPIRGEALLVKLAELLRGRVAHRAGWHNPFVLSITRGPRSRLVVDGSSYIEFHPNRSTYHMEVGVGADTTVTLETTDFDTLVQFVVQYIDGRLSEATALEVAS